MERQARYTHWNDAGLVWANGVLWTHPVLSTAYLQVRDVCVGGRCIRITQISSDAVSYSAMPHRKLLALSCVMAGLFLRSTW
jgi:hypothetical protein